MQQSGTASRERARPRDMAQGMLGNGRHMTRRHWTLDDLPWDRFDRTKVDRDIVSIAKAAALVEYNGEDYATYLCNVFHDDPDFRQVAREWAVEEVQHGAALGRWAEMADPGWRLEEAAGRFRNAYKLDLDASASVRGSRSGELIARCMVETGTSSYYTALSDACEEPVLKEICRRIAADELRHYKLFYTHLRRYLEREELGRLRRLGIALGRIRESEDDELACAFWAANAAPDAPYEHKRYSSAYMRRAYAFYRPGHVDRGMAMIFKAVGLNPRTRLCALATRMAWWLMERRVRSLAKAA